MNIIPSLRGINYTDQLKKMNIQSIERRFDRYRILYTRKALLGLVPTLGLSLSHDAGHRLGRMVQISKSNSKLKSDSFIIKGPETFNSLPKDIRNLDCSMETFKAKLDNFLQLIPDVPRIAVGHSYQSNSLKDQINNWKWRLDISSL